MKKKSLVNEKGSNKETDLGILTSKRIEELFGVAEQEEKQPEPSMPVKSKKQIKKDRNTKRSASMTEIWAKRKAEKEKEAVASPLIVKGTTLLVENKPLVRPLDETKSWRYPVITPLLAILRGKKKSEVTTEPEKEVPSNGHKPPVTVAEIEYREFIPQELPDKYKQFTPEWLYSGLDWSLQARELKPVDASNLREKLQIGLAVVVLALFSIVILCMFAIIVGGK